MSSSYTRVGRQFTELIAFPTCDEQQFAVHTSSTFQQRLDWDRDTSKHGLHLYMKDLYMERFRFDRGDVYFCINVSVCARMKLLLTGCLVSFMTIAS